MPTALSILAQELKWNADENGFAAALLRATPVALRGEETLIPVQDLLAAIQARPNSRDTLKRLLSKLTQIRHIQTPAGDYFGFTVLNRATWVDGSKFLQYELSADFLRALMKIAATRNIELV